LILQVTSLHATLRNNHIKAINIRFEFHDVTISFGDDLIPLCYRTLFVDALLFQCGNLHIFIGKHLLQLADLIIKVCPQSIKHLFSFSLFFQTDLLNHFVQFGGPLFYQGFLVCFCLSFQRVF